MSASSTGSATLGGVSSRRFAIVVAGAIAFGLFAAWAKGPATDGVHAVSVIRSTLGNLSAPWLLVGFLAGIQSNRVWVGAVLGLIATMAALLAFYLLTTALIDLHSHGYLADLRQELSANKAYLEGGVLSGPLFGALGGWWGRTRPLRVSILIGALLMAEPLVLILLQIALPGGALGPDSAWPAVIRIIPGWGLTTDKGPIVVAVYCVEFVLGAAFAAYGIRRSRRERASAATLSGSPSSARTA
jgi:hypothetical protein